MNYNLLYSVQQKNMKDIRLYSTMYNYCEIKLVVNLLNVKDRVLIKKKKDTKS